MKNGLISEDSIPRPLGLGPSALTTRPQVFSTYWNSNYHEQPVNLDHIT